MTDLHRNGRRAEALELFARVSRALAELDVTPGPALTTLRARIEADDPALEFCNTYAGWSARPTPEGTGCSAIRHWRSGRATPAWPTARSAADLLADPRRFTIRACPGEECGWLFLNEEGRRRWCSLATCGSSRTTPAIRF
jgi:predicted RNA-binding Zn ribbon-like protein